MLHPITSRDSPAVGFAHSSVFKFYQTTPYEWPSEQLPSSPWSSLPLAAREDPFFGLVLEPERQNQNGFAKTRIRTLDPEQRARGEIHQAALLGLLHREYWECTCALADPW